jgi:hypothetical protein
MPELPNLNDIDDVVLKEIEYNKNFITGIENYVKLNSFDRKALQNVIINLMLDSGVYDFELTEEKAKDAAHYGIVIKTNENSCTVSIVFPNQKVEDVL